MSYVRCKVCGEVMATDMKVMDHIQNHINYLQYVEEITREEYHETKGKEAISDSGKECWAGCGRGATENAIIDGDEVPACENHSGLIQ